MLEPMTSETLWKASRNSGSVLILKEHIPGVIAALKIKEALERELVEHRRLLAVAESDLVELSEAKNWYLVRYTCEKRDVLREEIRKIENHLKEGL